MTAPHTRTMDGPAATVDPIVHNGPVNMVRYDASGVNVERSEQRPTLEFSRDQEGIIRRMYAPGTSDDEFAVFLYVCKATGLNPLARQIHAMKRNQDGESRLTIQTGIDGFRIVAERTGKYAGQTSPEWCGDDGQWRDVWTSKTPPVAARVGVLMRGFVGPLYGVAHYAEYVQRKRDGTPNRMWKTMPANQLAKCAEALALRKSAPQELSGIYTTDEMGQADNVATATGVGGTTATIAEPTFPVDPHKGRKIGDPNIKTSQHVAIAEWIATDERRAAKYEATLDAILDELVRRVNDGIIDPNAGTLTPMPKEMLEALAAKLDKSPAAIAFTPVADAIIERLATLDADVGDAAIDETPAAPIDVPPPVDSDEDVARQIQEHDAKIAAEAGPADDRPRQKHRKP